jgi:hypothetical protein
MAVMVWAGPEIRTSVGLGVGAWSSFEEHATSTIVRTGSSSGAILRNIDITGCYVTEEIEQSRRLTLAASQ